MMAIELNTQNFVLLVSLRFLFCGMEPIGVMGLLLNGSQMHVLKNKCFILEFV